MKYVPPAHHRTVDAFREHLHEIDPTLGCDDAVEPDGPLASPIEVCGRMLGNRFAIHPMEGWDGTTDGLPSARTLRRWSRFGSSGAALIWGGEAFAVRGDGRANPNQLFLNDGVDVASGLTQLRNTLLGAHSSEVGGAPPVIGLQLTHSGRFARPEGPAAPMLTRRHDALDARYGTADVAPIDDDELRAIGARFVDAARLAADVGFDFVDVKCCHGYLLHELLSARSRPGAYGGDFEGRTRFFVEVVEAIRAACPDLEIGCRVSIADVQPHVAGEGDVGAPDEHASIPYDEGFGVDADDPMRFDLDEPIRFLELLRSLDVRLVNLTIGSPYYCPHVQRPATYPPSDGYLPPEDPLHGVARHLRVARACKAAVPELVYVGSGYTYLQEWLPHVAQHEVRGGHVDFVGLGRMVLSYPELPRDVLEGRPMSRKLVCRTFSDCTTAPRNGLVSGCYPLDPEYKRSPEMAQLKVIKKGREA